MILSVIEGSSGLRRSVLVGEAVQRLISLTVLLSVSVPA
jgi:hypothetical protein